MIRISSASARSVEATPSQTKPARARGLAARLVASWRRHAERRRQLAELADLDDRIRGLERRAATALAEAAARIEALSQRVDLAS